MPKRQSPPADAKDTSLESFLIFYQIHDRWPETADFETDPTLPSKAAIHWEYGSVADARIHARALYSQRQRNGTAPAPMPAIVTPREEALPSSLPVPVDEPLLPQEEPCGSEPARPAEIPKVSAEEVTPPHEIACPHCHVFHVITTIPLLCPHTGQIILGEPEKCFVDVVRVRLQELEVETARLTQELQTIQARLVRQTRLAGSLQEYLHIEAEGVPV